MTATDASRESEIGRVRHRKEDAHLITGATTWTDNIQLPGTLHMQVVRSPVAHARLGRGTSLNGYARINPTGRLELEALQNRRVLHLEDGRQFLKSSHNQYDLILYALVDSLVLHSSYSSLRLESFLFTQQAFEDVKSRLDDAGVYAGSRLLTLSGKKARVRCGRRYLPPGSIPPHRRPGPGQHGDAADHCDDYGSAEFGHDCTFIASAEVR